MDTTLRLRPTGRARALRIAGRVAAVLLALLALALCAAALAAWFTLPPDRQTGAIAGLGGPVDIRIDADGIPRIEAGNDLDAAAGLGFVHARDRMFQMELMRRAGSGRLSEIAGSATLRTDMLMRTLGLRARAQADLPLLPAHTRALLAAYARGVNAQIAARGRMIAPEFLAIGVPEPWTPVDSLLWGKLMALYLSGNYRDELSRLALARRIRPAEIDALWPPTPPPMPPQAMAAPAAPAGQAPTPAIARLAMATQAALPRFPERFTLPSVASNEWAVDGAHSATGAPLLAGDPHLALGLPAIWYLARMDMQGATLVGATAPGIPFLLIGHNAHIAWTFTTTGADTQDLFVETAVDKTHYAAPGGALAYVQHDETIHVLGSADVVLHVRQTRHGPVISDLAIQGLANTAQADGQVLAVSMAALAPGDTAPGGIDQLDRADSVAAALAAAPAITSPVQNLLVADRHGIALATTGRVPIRRSGDGARPMDGASGMFDWTGFASGRSLPQVVAPASGRLVNGNERVAGPDFPVFMGRDWYGDWRARRIRQLLGAHPRATVADFTAMQVDVVSLYARELLPVLLQTEPATEAGRRGLDLLRGWDGAMRRTDPQPLIFNAWLQRFVIDLMDQQGVPSSEAGPRMEYAQGVLTGGQSDQCSNGCAQTLATALDESMADLSHRLAGPPSGWHWGALHRARFSHAILGDLPWIGRLATRSIATSGDDATVGRAGMAALPAPDFTDRHGAAYRGVYDLADMDRSRFVIAPGQSGNLFSDLAVNFMRRWRDGETVPIGRDPPKITARLRLMPAAAKVGAVAP